MSQVNLVDYIRDIPDFPKPGIMFKDITPLLSSPVAFDAAVSRFAAGVDCSGFVSRCWRLDRPFSTRELPALCKKKPGIPMRQGCRAGQVRPAKGGGRSHAGNYNGCTFIWNTFPWKEEPSSFRGRMNVER